jgi:hypothetical protein
MMDRKCDVAERKRERGGGKCPFYEREGCLRMLS